MLSLELLIGLLNLFEPRGLIAQQLVRFFGNLQPDSELGVFIRVCGGIFVRREHQRSVPRRTDNSITIDEKSAQLTCENRIVRCGAAHTSSPSSSQFSCSLLSVTTASCNIRGQ